jgi:hypothetical protein
MRDKIVVMVLSLALAIICAGMCVVSITTGGTFYAVIEAALVIINLNNAWTMWRLL